MPLQLRVLENPVNQFSPFPRLINGLGGMKDLPKVMIRSAFPKAVWQVIGGESYLHLDKIRWSLPKDKVTMKSPWKAGPSPDLR